MVLHYCFIPLDNDNPSTISIGLHTLILDNFQSKTHSANQIVLITAEVKNIKPRCSFRY